MAIGIMIKKLPNHKPPEDLAEYAGYHDPVSEGWFMKVHKRDGSQAGYTWHSKIEDPYK